jgi:Glycosyl transferase family 2
LNRQFTVAPMGEFAQSETTIFAEGHPLHMIASNTEAKDSLPYSLAAARHLIAAGQQEQAQQSLRETQKAFPESADAFRLEADHLVSQLKYKEALSALRSCPLSDPNPSINEDTVFRAVKLQIYLAPRDTPVEFRQPDSAVSVEEAMIVMMIRDEADIIGQNLLHHYALGVRKFVIILNCCIDGTAKLVEAFKASHRDAIVCAIEDPVEGYYQSSKTQAAVEFAKAYFDAIHRPVEWCFILDADEFICSGSTNSLSNLIECARSAHKEFIAFNLCNSCPSSRVEFASGANPYSHFDTVVARAVPVVPKVAFRVALRPNMAMGNHSLYYPNIAVEHCFIAAEAGACLVHLPYRSLSQVKSKIVNGGSAYEATQLHAGLGAHWRRLYKDYLEQGDSVFARQLSAYNAETLGAARTVVPFNF